MRKDVPDSSLARSRYVSAAIASLPQYDRVTSPRSVSRSPNQAGPA